LSARLESAPRRGARAPERYGNIESLIVEGTLVDSRRRMSLTSSSAWRRCARPSRAPGKWPATEHA
jgi:hypothetical protein